MSRQSWLPWWGHDRERYDSSWHHILNNDVGKCGTAANDVMPRPLSLKEVDVYIILITSAYLTDIYSKHIEHGAYHPHSKTWSWCA
jgi:hypothetical protein